MSRINPHQALSIIVHWQPYLIGSLVKVLLCYVQAASLDPDGRARLSVTDLQRFSGVATKTASLARAALVQCGILVEVTPSFAETPAVYTIDWSVRLNRSIRENEAAASSMAT